MANTVIIRNGIFFDGSDAPGREVDVHIEDGRVAAIGSIPRIKGARTINAKGCWVMPGFLDIHTHYDAELTTLPGLEESIRHGTTTVVIGNCSLSSALGSEDDLVTLYCRVENLPEKLIKKWIKGKLKWGSPAEYYNALERVKLGPNIASFIGHSEIRIAAMGLEKSLKEPKASRAELKKMKSLVKDAMEAGFLGLSIDMLPFHRMYSKPYKGVSVPSQQAHHMEYSKLAKVVRRYSRVLQAVPNALSKLSVIKLLSMSTGVLRRNLKTTIVAAMDVKSDRKVHFLAPFLAKVFNTIFRADVKWQALPEPFLNFADGPITPLFEEFPSAVESISAEGTNRKKLFADPAFREKFRRDWEHKGPAVFHRNFDDMWIVSLPGKHKKHIGDSVGDIARAEGKDPIDCFMDLVVLYDTDFRWKSEVTNDRDEIRIGLLANENTIPGFSDSGAHNRNMAFYDFGLHVLRQSNERPDILPLHNAVHRLTRRTADWLGIDAGSLEAGAVADVAIIDPKKLEKGWAGPIEHRDKRMGGAMRLVRRTPGVVKHVLVGGETVFANNAFSPRLHKQRFGRLLRSQFNK